MIWWQFWCILVHFDAFWWTSCTTQWPLHFIQKWISITWPNLKCVVLSCYGDHFSAFLYILVHFDAFGCICSYSYLLSGIHLFQKWITLVTQDKFEMLCSVMVQWPFWCILVHFGPFWYTSWATPPPLCIEFSSGHQRYVSYASRAFKPDQSHLPSSIHSGNTDLTCILSMG